MGKKVSLFIVVIMIVFLNQSFAVNIHDTNESERLSKMSQFERLWYKITNNPIDYIILFSFILCVIITLAINIAQYKKSKKRAQEKRENLEEYAAILLEEKKSKGK